MPMEQTSELRRELERTTEVDEEVESELFRWRERVKNLESPPREEDAEKVRLEMELELRRSRDEVERLKKEVGELKETLVQGMEGKRRRTATGETKISSRSGNGLVEHVEKQANENRLPFNDEAFFNVLKHLLSTLSTDYKHDLSSLENALQFVRKADSIIWKKKMGTGEDRKIFDPENLRALEDRLMVWERLVRT
ncbi:hypothetical protein BT69DRAFT_513062 [Atractiella rhizophila]|nr:hypothetical protein BT69DRAFT_513062 [Atractiella rhizophila]